ncbi:retrovirus-related pol polyprotein from transposon TNT 1-94 [Tanacetum coccineum]|uniref:Retrovirus-related pol polyprotein from transposon TNT 1-94 n=1 Tax=Tanacetum coccineum TaxID=301880 RepID=A0ABQ5DE69_9ASTR
MSKKARDSDDDNYNDDQQSDDEQNVFDNPRTGDDEEETQEDEFMHTPENYLKDVELVDEGKGDEEMTDAEKVDAENENVNQEVGGDQVNDDAQETVTAALTTQKTEISKKARILELKRRHLKIIVLTTNTPYPSRKIRRICACTSQKTTKETRSIRRIQGRPIRRIQAMEIKYSGRYRTWLCMTRSSTKEQFTPIKEPKQEFRSSRKHFKTLSLDESRSPEFNLFFDLEEYSEEEVAETMAKTMDGSDHEDANEHIEKVLETVDLFHIPNITIDQWMRRAFHMSLTGAASHWLRNKPSGSITTCEDLKTKFLSKYFPPARTAKKMEEINNFQQEPDETLYQAWERFKELLMKCPR